MKKLIVLLVFFIAFPVCAQEDAWVYFTDKPDAAYYLANPLQMLSQKSLDRRAAQAISLDEKDVPVHEDYINIVASATGITLMAKSKWLNSLHIRGNSNDINALLSLPFVQSVEFADKSLNMQGRAAKAENSKSTVSKFETMAEFSYGNSASQIQMLNGHLLHQQDYTGAGITIAILDSGFPGVNTAQPFQRLVQNNLILGTYDFVDRSFNVYDDHSHGTMVLSTMAGYVEGELTGTAPDAFYYLFRTEDAGSENPVEESYWVEAAEMADSLGVDVINTSLGYFAYDNPSCSYTYNDIDGQTAFITRGANIAFTRGMICVTSAGNTATSANPHIGVPADAFNTLTVGAVNSSETYAAFSSIGPSFDGRVKPDIMAQGVSAIISGTTGNISTSNGTSFSSPITAGLVACLWQALPDKTNAEILQIIKESADRYSSPNIQYGYGIPDFSLALQNALGIEKQSKAEFALYPNPAYNEINIFLPTTEKANVSIFNNIGQLVIQQVVYKEKNSFSVEGLPAGVYFYKVNSGSVSRAGRLIKK